MLTRKIDVRPVTLSIFIFLLVISCKKQETTNNSTVDDETIAGYIYTSTNGEGLNQVVRFTRHDDGSLTDEIAFGTNSNGGADRTMGGDAHGDFDSQGAVQIIEDYLLTVNAGGNDVSVFGLDRTNGDLVLKNSVPSGGGRPVSITYAKKQGNDDEYWVIVGNQLNNPNVQKDGAAIERYPDNAFYQQDLTQPDASDNQRNIQLFSFNTSTGTMTSVMTLDTYVRENGGPTCVRFSDDGTKIAVTTWGIAHFATMMPLLDEQHPSRVYVYDFDNGSISGERHFEEMGIAGSIGFNWAKNDNNKLYVSNFNLTADKLDNSLTVLADDGSAVTKLEKHSTTSSNGKNESCWTAMNPAGNILFVASFATNIISAFDISRANANLFQSELRKGLAPEGDSKEVMVTGDGKFLYNLGSFNSFSINQFDLMGSGIRYKKQYILKATQDGSGLPGKYNFLGLAELRVN